MNFGIRDCLIGALATLGAIVGGSAARAGAPVAIYTFQGGSDGSFPVGNLVADPAGNLYGATEAGGTGGSEFIGYGTVFMLSPPAIQSGSWTEAVLYRFTGAADGGIPLAGLARDASGNIYGTTLAGGCLPTCNGQGYGTVFKLAPPKLGSKNWQFTTIWRFQPRYGVQDGAEPAAPLTLDGSGNLYGTTGSGGIRVGCCGTVFELTPPPPPGSGPWGETLLYAFGGNSDAVSPAAGVTFDASGNLYGTAAYGGLFGDCCGVVFQLSPPVGHSGPWNETILHRFSGRDGRRPVSNLVFDAAGNLYGAAALGEGNGDICQQGCGAAFELSPPAGGSTSWSEQTIYRFPGATTATSPLWVLYQAGTLYGAAGELFALTPSGKRYWNIVVTPFEINQGALPQSLATDPAVSGDSSFYGVAFKGGTSGYGTIFSWTP